MSQLQAGPTPVRRSARIESIAGSAAGSHGGPSIATTTATPSRGAAARRKGPLPKVKARQSHAYGSSGRLGAAEALTVPVTGFAQAFAAQRDDAVTRDEEENSEDESNDESIDELAAAGSRRRHQSVASSRPNERPEDHIQRSFNASRSPSLDAEDGGSLTVSNVDTSKSFGLVHEAGLTATREIRTSGIQHLGSAQNVHLGLGSAPPHRPQAAQFGAGPAIQQRPQFAPTRAVGPNGVPRAPARAFANPRPNGNPHIFSEAEPKTDEPWRWSGLVMGVLFILGATVVFTFFQSPYTSTSSPTSSSPTLFTAVGSRVSNSWDDFKNWVNYEKIPGVNSPVVDGEGRPLSHPGYEFVYDRTTKLERKTKAIETSLEILKEHLPPSLAVNRNKKGNIIIPDDYWRALISKLKADGITGPRDTFDGEWHTFLEKNRQKILTTVQDEVKSPAFQEHLHIVGRDEFIRVMKDEYTKHTRLVDQKVNEAVNGMSKDMKVLIKDNVNKAVMDQVRIESLAYANLVANTELNLRKVNYFSTGLGAHVEPYETSSTYIGEKSAPASLYRRIFSGPGRRPPVTALQKWDEPGDCWCAAPDEDGKGLAQLSVLLGHEMYPRQVTIEHVPKQATLDVTSAPRDIELWAELPTGSTHRVQAADGCLPGPKGYYCLGKFSYNVHGNNHVQTFNLDVDTTHPVSKTLLRVTDNWGSDHTCIYRVRLHGESVSAAE